MHDYGRSMVQRQGMSHLMPKATTSTVNHDAHLIFLINSHLGGGRLVINLLHYLTERNSMLEVFCLDLDFIAKIRRATARK